jgi:hypothetical protein
VPIRSARSSASSVRMLTTPAILDGFLLLSSASRKPREGMWGGLKRPIPVAELKRHYPKLRVGLSEWREAAVERVRAALRRGDLAFYVMAADLSEPMPLPVELAQRLVSWRGEIITDRPIRLPHSWARDGLISSQTFLLLKSGVFVVRRDEFEAWYRDERRRTVGPRSESKRGRAGEEDRMSAS